jgi:hypothetical protein
MPEGEEASMEDLSALASRVGVAFDGLRGCLILDRDGLVLGCYPPAAEQTLKPQWLRFAGVGEMDKAFVEFGDELWVYVRRGHYGAFAVGDVTIRPGLLIDHLEQAILAAEESRGKREALRIPDAPPAPTGRPRTSLHKEPKATPEPEPVSTRSDAGAAAVSSSEPAGPSPATDDPAPTPSASAAGTRPEQEPEDSDEVDRVLLAQEFSRLLQEGPQDDEEQ